MNLQSNSFDTQKNTSLLYRHFWFFLWGTIWAAFLLEKSSW